MSSVITIQKIIDLLTSILFLLQFVLRTKRYLEKVLQKITNKLIVLISKIAFFPLTSMELLLVYLIEYLGHGKQSETFFSTEKEENRF
jgi:hypothetical protein